MSYTTSRSRTSTRGYYNMDQHISQRRGRSIQIITDITRSNSPASSSSSLSSSRPHTAIPYVPEPPSPSYRLPRSSSFHRERRMIEANIVTRSPDHYPAVPSHFTMVHREPQRQIEMARSRPSSHQERYELALVPVQHRDRAIIVERSPRVKPVVVERKETIMIKDDQGRWCKVRRVVR